MLQDGMVLEQGEGGIEQALRDDTAAVIELNLQTGMQEAAEAMVLANGVDIIGGAVDTIEVAEMAETTVTVELKEEHLADKTPWGGTYWVRPFLNR